MELFTVTVLLVTYYVSGRMLNPTHSLTHSLTYMYLCSY